MNITLSYDDRFETLLSNLKDAYGEGLFELEGIGANQLDLNHNAKTFLENQTCAADVSVDANANVDSRDVIGYQFELPKPLFRLNSLYLLWKQLEKTKGVDFANMAIAMQITGGIYINDCTDVGRPYCFNFSCYDIVLEGLPMIKKITSVAPKTLYAFKSQVEQFIIVAANSTLGATGLADLFICMSLYYDKIMDSWDDWKESFCDGHIAVGNSHVDVETYIRETLVSLIYTLNQPMRGNQSPFTNVSLYDSKFLEELCHSYVLEGNAANPRSVELIQTLFMEVMNEELRRTPITFPVTTACFAVDDNGRIMDGQFRELIAKQNTEWGFINIYCGKTSTLSSCCRLRSESDNEYFNSFGAGSTKIGSLGVVTLNLPRLAEMANGDIDKFIKELIPVASLACVINEAKRQILKKRVDDGNMPLYTHGHMALNKQYSTIGVTGLYEAVKWLGADITTFKGESYVGKILDNLHSVCTTHQQIYKAPHNIEQVPAESSSIKIASKDFYLGFNMNVLGDQIHSYYSNQFIPLTVNTDLLERIRLQGLFDREFSGGAICHLNIEERITDPKRIEELIDHCAKAGVVYWAVNYNLRRCADGHMSVGKTDTCDCGKPVVENFTRVVGFLTNVSNWHKVRRSEDYPQREFYTV